MKPIRLSNFFSKLYRVVFWSSIIDSNYIFPIHFSLSRPSLPRYHDNLIIYDTQSLTLIKNGAVVDAREKNYK